jgi:hypothetical protein
MATGTARETGTRRRNAPSGFGRLRTGNVVGGSTRIDAIRSVFGNVLVR